MYKRRGSWEGLLRFQDPTQLCCGFHNPLSGISSSTPFYFLSDVYNSQRYPWNVGLINEMCTLKFTGTSDSIRKNVIASVIINQTFERVSLLNGHSTLNMEVTWNYVYSFQTGWNESFNFRDKKFICSISAWINNCKILASSWNSVYAVQVPNT